MKAFSIYPNGLYDSKAAVETSILDLQPHDIDFDNIKSFNQ